MSTSRVLLAAVAAVGALAVAGCGGDATTTVAGGAGKTQTGATTGAGEVNGCLPAGDQPDAGKKPTYKAAEKVLKDGAARIVMTTSCGVITIELDRKNGGPIPNSIAFLAAKKFYDGLTFHRVVPDFVLQGGDPNGDGSGDAGYEVVGPVPTGYTYKVGDVAMAKTSVAANGTSGSQFFVVSSDNGAAILTQQPVYGVLGHATDPTSLATIKRIAGLGVTDGPPSQPVWIVSATVEQ